jgi:hypothetical protein
MRPVATIPTSVTVLNLQTTRVDFAGLGAVPGSGTVTYDMTKLSGNGIEPNSSPKSRLWHAIAHSHLKGTVSVTSTTPSISITSGVDGLEFGTIAADANVLRPGMPDYREDGAGPLLVSLVVEANDVYADLTFTEGVYHAADKTKLVAADLNLVFTKGGGTATGCAIASVKKPNGATAAVATALTGGESVIRVFLTVTGTANGQETLTINSVASAVSDAKGAISPVAQVVSDVLNVVADSAGPVPQSLVVVASNVYADLTFDEGVYHGADGSKLVAGDLNLVFTKGGGTATACTIAGIKKPDAATLVGASALVGGETVVRVFLTITGTPNGAETIAINCVATSVADYVTNKANAATTVSDTLNA